MKQSELSNYSEVIAAARVMWKKSAEAYYNEKGDVGSCVLGSGITVDVVPPRCRKPRKMMLISSHEVARCQGSLHWEHNVGLVVDYLRANGVDAKFDWGRMD